MVGMGAEEDCGDVKWRSLCDNDSLRNTKPQLACGVFLRGGESVKRSCEKFFLLKLNHSHVRVKLGVFLWKTLIQTGQDSIWLGKDACFWEEIVFCKLERLRGCATMFTTAGSWFQKGLKCVQFLRTPSGRERAWSGQTSGGGTCGIAPWRPRCAHLPRILCSRGSIT